MVSLEDPEIAAEFFGKVNLGGDGKRDATVAPKKQEASASEDSSGNVNRRPPSPIFWKERSVGELTESPATFDCGVIFFSKSKLHYFAPDSFEGTTNLGVPGKPLFFMPAEESGAK